MNLNKTIFALRAERSMTQEKLAELVGVSTAAVSKWECGNSYPDITLLPKLAEIFDVSMDYLFGYTKADEKTVPETVAETTRLGKEGKREDAIALLRQTCSYSWRSARLTPTVARGATSSSPPSVWSTVTTHRPNSTTTAC